MHTNLAIFALCLVFPGTPPAADQVQTYLTDLSSPNFQTREEAAARLMESGPEVLGVLRNAFHATGLYDAKRRMKDIAREVYLTDKLGPPRAFLGITHNRYDLKNTEDGRVPPGVTAIRIESIFPGTSAERAGIAAGDLLIALNGVRATLEEPATKIPLWIATKPPNTPCKFTVIRGGSGVRLEVGDRNRPINVNKLARAPMEVVTPTEQPLVSPGAAGLRLGENIEIAEGVTLQRGDVIVSLNDQPLPAEDARGTLLTWTGQVTKQPDTQRPDEMEVRVRNGRPQLVPRGAPSIQIVRGGTVLELEARLGRRPAMLRNSANAQTPWQAEPAAIEQATQQFETWWTESVDPEGTFSEQAGGDKRWRMESGRR